jgi:putative transposase
LTHDERVAAIDRAHPDLPISRQADLLDISRASIYYVPVVDEQDLRIMNRMDEIFTEAPTSGSRTMKAILKREGMLICREHAQRLMRVMGLEAIYPKKGMDTSIPDNTHRKYPYLLRNVPIVRSNQVWGTDITYVRLKDGWAYLVAILDWFSRYVVSWELSLTLETEFCITALERALAIATPDIFNSDQGSQFTANEYTSILEGHGIRISMDGRGRCFDNIFTERLWRTVKYEHVYLHDRRDVHETRCGLDDYFTRYNTKRPHQSLDDRTPEEVYFKS